MKRNIILQAVTLILIGFFVVQASNAQQPPVPNPAKVVAEREKEKEQNTEEEFAVRSTKDLFRNTKVIEGLFKPCVQTVRHSMVNVIGEKDKRLVLGTVVRKDGFVLTKASELKGNIRCEFADGTKLSAAVFGIDKDNDLALLKVDAKDLFAVQFPPANPELSIGSWLVSSDISEQPLSVGVLSVVARKIDGGMLGVRLSENDRGVIIIDVLKNSPADKAQIKANDVVTAVNGEPVQNLPDLQQKIKRHAPGERVEMALKRDGKQIIARPILDHPNAVQENGNRAMFQNRMGTTLSKRRSGFQSVLQHDTMLSPDQCGGLIVDIDGNIVGINIARSGRVCSFALPTSIVAAALPKLFSGELTPAIVNKPRIMLIEKELALLQSREDALPEDKTEVEKQVAELDEKLDDFEEAIKSAQRALETLQKEFDSIKSEKMSKLRVIRRASSELRKIEKARKELLKEKDALEFKLSK